MSVPHTEEKENREGVLEGLRVFTAGVGAVVAGPAMLTIFPPVIVACGGGAAIAASFTFGAAGLVQGAKDGFRGH